MPELLGAQGGVCRNLWGPRGGYAGTCCCCCCCCGTQGTQHVPAGEIARHALPGQGAREQSAGVTLAGRVPTTTEGGGVPPSVCGGEGARVAVRGTTCPCDPGSLPRRGGRACAPVRNRGGMGGGMEGPPVRGFAGPRFPLLPAATPPRRGRGLRPVRRWSKGVGGEGTMYGLSPGARPCVPCAGGRAARPAGGSRPGPGAWVAAGGRGGGGALRVRGPWRSRGGVGGPAGGRRWP